MTEDQLIAIMKLQTSSFIMGSVSLTSISSVGEM